jgi:hypothetical protein
MRGSRIRKAIACLELYLHSLPTNGYFNIVRFGSQFKVMWDQCREVTDESIQTAFRQHSERLHVLMPISVAQNCQSY